jgi:hypothetical protein
MSDNRFPICQDEQRRIADVRAEISSGGQALFLLNGIDYLEVDPADHRNLRVFFLKPLAPANAANPADPQDALGITGDLSRITISGGVRVVGIRPVSATRAADGHLDLTASDPGDFSTYTLTIDAPGLDPFRRSIDFSFMANCPVDFDCKSAVVCPPRILPELPLDYQAKDYSSFRRLLLDLLPTLNPQFTERNPSDLGIALLELLAYTGDNLSYFQDAVANEGFLETVRRRISARRHARLVDYRMHDGRNAFTWIHVNVTASLPLPEGTRFVTRIVSPLAHRAAPPGAVFDAALLTAETLETDPALVNAVVFESAQPASLIPLNNQIAIHTWGDEQCCMAPGSREAYLYSVSGDTAVRPVLENGDYLLLEEIKGPTTGLDADADADATHRQIVRLDQDPEATEDPVYTDTLVNGDVRRRLSGDPALPLLRVHWRREDALSFPLCLSARPAGKPLIRDVSVARGNLVLADHGITTSEAVALAAPAPDDRGFRIELSRGPLTMQCQPDSVQYDPGTASLITPRPELTCDVREAQPAVSLLVTFPTGTELWTPVPDLLDSPPFAQQFVAEVDDDGRAMLRFGDGEYGLSAGGATSFQVIYRVGNGAAGNAGAGAIAHVALSPAAAPIAFLRNPLPATRGLDPETIEQVRRAAPDAFRAEQFRAVTEADYAAAAKKLASVAGAAASFRWTGSWYTVFVAIDPRDPEDLVRGPKGLAVLSDRLTAEVLAFLTTYRLAGYDLEIRPPAFVPLEIDLLLCVSPDHFRADVAHAAFDALSNRVLPDGTLGFFHPDNFTFAQPVYLSQIYAAAARVPGVESVQVPVFRRAGHVDNGELASGVLRIGPAEIALCDNDPNFQENGRLRIEARGGKG